jgi:hypothetical protein
MHTGRRKHSSWTLVGLLAIALLVWFALNFLSVKF